MSTPRRAPDRLACDRSAPSSSAMMRAPERFAFRKLGRAVTSPPTITMDISVARERSAPKKFVPINQAPFRLAPERFAPEKLHCTSLLAKKLVRTRFARWKSCRLKSRRERSFPASTAVRSPSGVERICCTCSTVRSSANIGRAEVASTATTKTACIRFIARFRITGDSGKVAGMESKVVFDETCDEKVTVVVTVLHAQRERHTALRASFLQ